MAEQNNSFWSKIASKFVRNPNVKRRDGNIMVKLGDGDGHLIIKDTDATKDLNDLEKILLADGWTVDSNTTDSELRNKLENERLSNERYEMQQKVEIEANKKAQFLADEQGKNLPKGWKIIKYSDGSGYIETPGGKEFAEIDDFNNQYRLTGGAWEYAGYSYPSDFLVDMIVEQELKRISQKHFEFGVVLNDDLKNDEMAEFVNKLLTSSDSTKSQEYLEDKNELVHLLKNKLLKNGYKYEQKEEEMETSQKYDHIKNSAEWRAQEIKIKEGKDAFQEQNIKDFVAEDSKSNPENRMNADRFDFGVGNEYTTDFGDLTYYDTFIEAINASNFDDDEHVFVLYKKTGDLENEIVTGVLDENTWRYYGATENEISEILNGEGLDTDKLDSPFLKNSMEEFQALARVKLIEQFKDAGYLNMASKIEKSNNSSINYGFDFPKVAFSESIAEDAENIIYFPDGTGETVFAKVENVSFNPDMAREIGLGMITHHLPKINKSELNKETDEFEL